MVKRIKGGFTLIELLMVVAIIALISTLAVQKLSGLKTDMKARMNAANMKRIDNAIETYVVANSGNGLNRLDLLMEYDEAARLGSGTRSFAADFSSIEEPPSYMKPSLLSISNQGLHTNLVTITSQYGTTFSPLLGKYHLSTTDAKALKTLGMEYAMAGTDGNRQRAGADGAWAQGSPADPDKCQCVAVQLTNGVAVACVNPFSVSSDIQPSGCGVYNACGEKIWFGTDMKLHIDGKPAVYGNSEDALKALYEAGGPGILLAFGLGDFAGLIGDNKAGLDVAPYCPDVEEGVYRRYLVLIRLKTTRANGVEAEYAGLVDPRGRTFSQVVGVLQR